jgi:hypothetical protein
MKKMMLIFALCGLMMSIGEAQVNLKTVRSYNYPLDNWILKGLGSIRCVAVAKNLEGDGKVLIAVTNYSDKGHVSVFTPSASGTTLDLVWSSPHVDSTPTMGGGNSSPRNVLFADLDGDGRKEIIFESNNNGVYVYEWDGVKGSHNFGTKPSQLIGPANLPDFTKSAGGNNATEHMEVTDIDGDGQQELVIALKGATVGEQKFMIISAIGDWSTDDPGFSGFTMEYMSPRADWADWGLNGGTIYAMNCANLNGGTRKQAILSVFDHKAISILRATGANTYAKADLSNGKGSVILTPSADGVALFGGATTDIDKDGCEEVYLPTYSSDTTTSGLLHMISYAKNEDVSQIDMAKNVTTIDLTSITKYPTYGIAVGDMDGNGKPNIYLSTGNYGATILTTEFQGGDKKVATNWKSSVFYKGDTTFYSALSIRDSVGRVDTISRTANIWFPSKFVAGVDIDGNGREEIISGFQPWLVSPADSITVTKSVWNTTKKAYDSTTYGVLNTHRASLAVLERNASTGVIEQHELPLITPDDYKLNQNYPNPFNPSTQISFTLPENNAISMTVYDMLGKEVRTLINNEQYKSGTYSITWNGKDNSGASVASGTYIYKLKTEYVEKSMKMMLLK